MANIKIEKGSNNVFKDLGYANPEERLVKAELARLINVVLKKKKTKEKWTQVKAAEVMDIPQSKVSLLSRGIVSGFSLGKLLSLLTKLDQDIDIVIYIKQPAKKTHKNLKGCFRVIYV